MDNIMDQYARAAATLYGIIGFDDFFNILDSYYGEGSLSKDRIMAYFWASKVKDPVYYIQGELIVHASIPPDDIARTLAGIQHSIGDKAPQYHRILPEKEFLLYANPLYYEDSPGTRNMEAYLVAALGRSPDEAREIVAEMAFICRSGSYPTFVIDALDRRGYPTKKEEKLDLILIALDIEAETRQWERLGATGREMSGR